jgi:hypothetical protein
VQDLEGDRGRHFDNTPDRRIGILRLDAQRGSLGDVVDGASGGHPAGDSTPSRLRQFHAMPERIARANGKRSAIRSAVDHVFAGQKHRMGLFIRTIGIARARIKIGLANLAYDFPRLAWLEGRPVPA